MNKTQWFIVLKILEVLGIIFLTIGCYNIGVFMAEHFAFSEAHTIVDYWAIGLFTLFSLMIFIFFVGVLFVKWIRKNLDWAESLANKDRKCAKKK